MKNLKFIKYCISILLILHFSLPLQANNCFSYLNPNDRNLTLRINELMPEISPLDMPKQILSRRENRLVRSLNTVATNEFFYILLESELVLSDFLNSILKKQGLTIQILRSSTPDQMQLLAENLYQTIYNELYAKDSTHRYLLSDVYFTKETFRLVPKELMLKILAENLKLIVEYEDYIVQKNPNILKMLINWLENI